MGPDPGDNASVPPAEARLPIPAAAAVTIRPPGEVLLIQRGKEPNLGRWSFPGGAVEFGETARAAARRETREETGLDVAILDVADVVDLFIPAAETNPDYHFCVTDFLAVPLTDADPRPADDAREARWVPLAEVDQYDLTPAMYAVLARAVALWRERVEGQAENPPRRHGDTEEKPVGAPLVGALSDVASEGGRPRGSPLHDVSVSPCLRGQGLLDPTDSGGTVHETGEFGLIARLLESMRRTEGLPVGGHVRLGVGDDAALLETAPGRLLVATADALVEGVHFRRDWTGPEDLGWKTLAVNVSDVAAMGGEPLAALISLALPPATEVAWVEALYRGLEACATAYRCALAGGDTVGSPDRIVLHVALLGTVEPERVRTRAGARPGDLVCVTGTLGDSAAGLALLRAGGETAAHPEWAPLLRAHRRPAPRLAAARALAADPAVTALMDLSDGIAGDLRHIAERSQVSAREAGGCGARVRAADLPISPETRAAAALLGTDPVEWALRGGEDYELLFTLAPEALPRLAAILAGTETAATPVGVMTEAGYTLVRPDGTEVPLSPAGFAHFG
jgi:thiamine-monophosphate kinase